MISSMLNISQTVSHMSQSVQYCIISFIKYIITLFINICAYLNIIYKYNIIIFIYIYICIRC